jgi:hypothetical protein
MDDQSTEIHKVRKSKSIAFRGDLEGAPTFRQFVMTGIRLNRALQRPDYGPTCFACAIHNSARA